MTEKNSEITKCGRCQELRVIAPCMRKGCTDRADRVRFVGGNLKTTCGRHTPCCKGETK
jgi:hypothetical protein